MVLITGAELVSDVLSVTLCLALSVGLGVLTGDLVTVTGDLGRVTRPPLENDVLKEELDTLGTVGTADDAGTVGTDDNVVKLVTEGSSGTAGTGWSTLET